MLDELRRIYESYANVIPNWKNTPKEQLIQLYIQNEANRPIANAYFSAIMCRYWVCIDRAYAKNKSSATPEDCYDWVLYAIKYALKHRVWLDEKNALYGDKNGADKAINRCIYSAGKGFYQKSNYQKHRANWNTISIDNEDNDIDIPYESNYSENAEHESIVKLINTSLTNKNYFYALLIDSLAYEDVFLSIDGHTQLCYRKLIFFLKHIDKAYCKDFLSKYRANTTLLLNTVQKCRDLPHKKLREWVDSNLQRLKSDIRLIGE